MLITLDWDRWPWRQVLLDPCGGIGVLAIEAANLGGGQVQPSATAMTPRVHPRLQPRWHPAPTERDGWVGRRPQVLCVDSDIEACAAARANASAARGCGSLRGSLDVLHADGLGLPVLTATVDVALADLPFGLRHAKLDVAAMMRELARVVRLGGRALLFGSAQQSAAAVIKVVRKQQSELWSVEQQTECYSGGVPCVAVLLARTSESPDPPSNLGTNKDLRSCIGLRLAASGCPMRTTKSEPIV